MLDVLEMYRGPFTETSSRIYKFIVDHIPGLWGFFYQSDLSSVVSPVSGAARGTENKKIPRLFQQKQPGFDFDDPPFRYSAGFLSQKNRGIPRASGNHL